MNRCLRTSACIALLLATPTSIAEPSCEPGPPPYPHPPIPLIASYEASAPVDAAHEARTKPWWDYAASVRGRTLRCRAYRDERIYFDGDERLRWTWAGSDLYYRAGAPYLFVNEDRDFRLVQYFEDGEPVLGEVKVGSTRRYWTYPLREPAP